MRISNVKYVAYTDYQQRTWLVGLNDHKDSYNVKRNIWVSSRPSFRGLGGREMTFDLKCGDSITMIGPWHSNVISFVDNVGIPISVFE